ncbi:15873_t:CDS:2 [Gigaspora rosea]|nr:15873_t:CDS:2 [Gigaspora rosea]
MKRVKVIEYKLFKISILILDYLSLTIDELSLSTNSTVKSKIVWRPLLPNLRCIQVSLPEVPSVLDLYSFDTISSGGGNLSEGYTILSQDCTNNGRLCDWDVKSITLIDEDAIQLSKSKLAYVEYLKCSIRKGRIVVLRDKPLNLCNIKCYGNHDPEHVRKKPYRMSKIIRKEITSRSTNVAPSILATEFMNNAKISSITSNTPANQVQPTSIRFTPNLEAIQNALKYDKKLHYPNKLIKPSQLTMSSMDSHGNTVIFTMPAFTNSNIHKQAKEFALLNPNSHTHLLLQVLDRMKNKQWLEAKILWAESLSSYSKLVNDGEINFFGGLSERFFEQFFQDPLDQNLLVVKSTITTICDSEYCPRKVLSLANCYDIILIKTQVCILPGSNYFETYLRQWKEPFITPCGSEFKTMNGEKPKNISISAFRYLYICSEKAISTRQIDQQLLLILAINVTGISIIDEEIYLENKDLSEEISFPPDDIHLMQRYRLMNVSFCNGNHYIADVRFENIKDSGWYHYDGLGKTYRARAMYIGNARPPRKDGYAMDLVIYVKI